MTDKDNEQKVQCSYPGCTNFIVHKQLALFPNINPSFDENKEYYCDKHNQTYKCTSCDELFTKNNLYDVKLDYDSVEHGLFCKECYDDLYSKCNVCKQIVNNDDLLDTGCKNCCEECYSCNRVVNKDNVHEFDGDSYCENCFDNAFTTCEDCDKTISNDRAMYTNDRTICERCFDNNYFICENCGESYTNDESQEMDGRYYCQYCAEKTGGAEEFSDFTENFSHLNYTKKDRFLKILLKLAPISIKDLKSKHPSLAQAANELIAFSKGKPITSEMIISYRESIPNETFPINYTTWKSSLQRSIDSLSYSQKESLPKSQLVMNVLASPNMLSKLKSTAGLYELFNTINNQSKSATHPYIEDQIGWIRLELDPKNEYILIDEIQCDHENAISRLKSSVLAQQINDIIKTYNISIKPVDDLYIVDTLENSIKEQVILAGIDKEIINRILTYKKLYYYRASKYKELIKNKYKIDDNFIDQTGEALRLYPLFMDDFSKIKELRQKLKTIFKVNDNNLNSLLRKNTHSAPDNIIQELAIKYNLSTDNIKQLLSEYYDLVKDFPNIAVQSATEFAKANNFKRVFWHTYEGGKHLKSNEPPKSLYDKIPKENFFLPSENRPFNLEADFLEREATLTKNLYKISRKLILKRLNNVLI